MISNTLIKKMVRQVEKDVPEALSKGRKWLILKASEFVTCKRKEAHKGEI